MKLIYEYLMTEVNNDNKIMQNHVIIAFIILLLQHGFSFVTKKKEEIIK